MPCTVTGNAVGSYPTLSPLPTEVGGLLSVALSVALRRPGVTWQSALWSSDFPRPAQDGPRPPRPTNLKQDTVQDGVREAGVDAPFGLKLTRSTNAVDARDSMLKPV